MKILLIDDSRATRYALRIELKKLGIEVETADSAEAALAMLKERIPDAILMDHIMPGLNGLEALEIIHADPRTAHVPIVLCTSQEDSEIEAMARRKGVIDLLTKSSATARLPEVIGRVRARIESGQAVSAVPTDPAASMAPGAPSAPAGWASEAELLERVDARIEAALDRRLTSVIEAVRHDLTEMLIAETRHLVESRLAEERAARDVEATTQPPGEPETRLMDERIRQLISEHWAAAWPAQRADLAREVVASRRPVGARVGATDEPWSGGVGRGPLERPARRSDSSGSIGALAMRVRDRAMALAESLRAAIKWLQS